MDNEKEINIDEVKKAMKLINGNDGNVKFIEADDYFSFHCLQCGKCCMNRDDILLNPFDIYNMSQYLGNITTEEFVDKYCNVHIGGGSKLPIVTMKTNEDNGFCPFLEYREVESAGVEYNNKLVRFYCKAEQAKPGVCRNHPIGRIKNVTPDNKDDWSGINDKYVIVDSCPQSKIIPEQHKVSEWIGNTKETPEDRYESSYLQIGIWGNDDMGKIYRTFTFLLATEKADTQDNETAANMLINYCEKSLAFVYDVTYSLTYCGYKLDKPFAEQAHKRAEDLKKFIEDIKDLTEKLSTAMYAACEKLYAGDNRFKEAVQEYIEKCKVDKFETLLASNLFEDTKLKEVVTNAVLEGRLRIHE